MPLNAVWRASKCQADYDFVQRRYVLNRCYLNVLHVTRHCSRFCSLGNPTATDSAVDVEDMAEAFASEAANAIKMDGVNIISVGIGSEIDAAYLASLASGPELYLSVSDFDRLDELLGSLVRGVLCSS